MIKYKAYAYFIECLSNLHVGSGDNNYGVVDKQVQRDSISLYPIIHATSLKGALREYFEECIEPTETKLTEIFGSDKNDRVNMQQGKFRFLEARLLSFPLRALDKELFYMTTSRSIIELFNKTAENLSVDNFKNFSATPTNETIGETEYGKLPLCSGLEVAGERLVLSDDETLKKALTNLPVLARNSLENGQSENLWYEEVVPWKTRFYFFVIAPEGESIDYERNFNRHLDKKTIQIGANATVGYGYCKIYKLT